MTRSYQLKPFVVVTELHDGSIKFCSTVGRSYILHSKFAHLYTANRDILFSAKDSQSLVGESDQIALLRDELLRAGLIECKVPDGDGIPNRYRSQMTFFSLFDGAEKKRQNYYQRLRETSVVIIGMGGVGCHVAMALTLAGVRELIVVDYDIIEEHNFNRQFLYTHRDLGKKKTEVAANKLKELNPDILVRSVDKKITCVEDVQELLDNVHFLCCAADFPFHYIYRWINQACISGGIPWIQANSAEASGFVGPLVVPGNTSCYGCIEEQWQRNDPNYLFEIDQLNRDKSLYHEKATSLSAAIGMLGNYAALEIIKSITGFAPPETLDCQVSIDFGTMNMSKTQFARLGDCPVCAEKRTDQGLVDTSNGNQG